MGRSADQAEEDEVLSSPFSLLSHGAEDMSGRTGAGVGVKEDEARRLAQTAR